MTEIDQESVVDQVDALENQRAISEAQAANADVELEDWNFFSFADLYRYYVWQFYTESPRELVLTTILGVSAVSLISMVFIPHWTCVIFVAPMIDFHPVCRLAGISPNGRDCGECCELHFLIGHVH